MPGLHGCFGLQAQQVSRDGRHSERAITLLVGHGAVSRVQIAIDLNRIPTLSVPDIVDSNVIVLAPKERHGIESFATTKNIFCRNLSLTLSHYPVLYTDSFPGMRIGPPCNVARSIDTGHTGLEVFIDDDTAIDRQTSSLGKS